MELSADVFGCGCTADWQGEIDDLSRKPSQVTGLRRPGKEVILAALKSAATPPNHLHMVLLKLRKEVGERDQNITLSMNISA